MPNVRLDKKLLEKLAAARKAKPKSMVEYISRMAGSKGVRPQALFAKLLIDYKIGAQLYLRKLDNDTRQEVRELQRSAAVDTSVAAPRTHSHLRRRSGRSTRNDGSIAPWIDEKDVTDARGNADIYPALYLFENSVRKLIVRVLSKAYGDSWWTQVNPDIRNEVDRRIQEERSNPWHGSRGTEKIFYTDFKDLSKIIKANPNNFNPLFSGLPNKNAWLTQKLDELALSRHNIAHTVPLSAHDRLRLEGYYNDWKRLLPSITAKI